MKKMTSFILLVSFCMTFLSVISFAESTVNDQNNSETIVYAEDMGTIMPTSNTESQGEFGTITPVVGKDNNIGSNGGALRIYTYTKNANAAKYKLNALDSATERFIGSKIVMDARHPGSSAIVETKYLVSSDEDDYFAFVMNFATGKMYTKVMSNGTAIQEEIPGVVVENTTEGKKKVIEFSVEGTTVSYSIGSEAEGTFDVPEMASLNENCEYQVQFCVETGGWEKGYWFDDLELYYKKVDIVISGKVATYAEDMGTIMPTSNTESQGEFGTITPVVGKDNNIGSNGGALRIYTYTKNANAAKYKLNVPDTEFEELTGSKIVMDARHPGASAIVETKYLVSSDEDDYFAFVMNFATGKMYTKVVSNGTAIQEEIPSVVVENTTEGKKKIVEFSIEGTTVSYSIGSEVEGTFNVPNMASLNENCEYQVQFCVETGGWEKGYWFDDLELHCRTMSAQVKFCKAEHIGDAEVMYETIEVLADTVTPLSCFVYGGIDVENTTNNIKCTEQDTEEKQISTLCFGNGYKGVGSINTFGITNENKKYSKLKFNIKLSDDRASDNFNLNFGYTPISESWADFDYHKRTLQYKYNIKDYLDSTTEWQTVEIPLTEFTAEKTNKYAIPGTATSYTYQKVDWSNFNIIMLSVDKVAENQGFEISDVSFIVPKISECSAKYALTNLELESINDLSSFAGKNIGCYVKGINNKTFCEEVSVICLVYKNDKLVDSITKNITIEPKESTKIYCDMFNVPLNTEGYEIKMFLVGHNDGMDVLGNPTVIK